VARRIRRTVRYQHLSLLYLANIGAWRSVKYDDVMAIYLFFSPYGIWWKSYLYRGGVYSRKTRIYKTYAPRHGCADSRHGLAANLATRGVREERQVCGGGTCTACCWRIALLARNVGITPTLHATKRKNCAALLCEGDRNALNLSQHAEKTNTHSASTTLSPWRIGGRAQPSLITR